MQRQPIKQHETCWNTFDEAMLIKSKIHSMLTDFRNSRIRYSDVRQCRWVCWILIVRTLLCFFFPYSFISVVWICFHRWIDQFALVLRRQSHLHAQGLSLQHNRIWEESISSILSEVSLSLQLGMWKRLILAPLAPLPLPLPLPFCSTNTSSYPILQNGSGQSLPHP